MSVLSEDDKRMVSRERSSTNHAGITDRQQKYPKSKPDNTPSSDSSLMDDGDPDHHANNRDAGGIGSKKRDPIVCWTAVSAIASTAMAAITAVYAFFSYQLWQLTDQTLAESLRARLVVTGISSFDAKSGGVVLQIENMGSA